MKICVGINHAEEYLACAEAGADEVYCGYVPHTWMEEYGPSQALNRREVAYYNVQIGSLQELRILKKMEKKAGIPVVLTFNSPFYAPEQYEKILRIMQVCMEEGFSSFIVADPQLMLLMKRNGILKSCSLHISGESSALNIASLEQYLLLSPRRIIFGRKTAIDEMKLYSGAFHGSCSEYEAFILNENCFFSGWSCCSLHCDELRHICRIPEKKDGNNTDNILPDFTGTGAGGCGLCSLWKLRDAGVTHLKIVSRGAFTDDTVNDVAQLKKALNILEQSKSELIFRESMKHAVFSDGCSHSCYYN